MIQDGIASTERQMAPEFDVIGDADLFEGGVVLSFRITRRRSRRARGRARSWGRWPFL
jgi:hypothetical protein